ncbi:MAG: carbohydrate binding domain-containing protein [Candidatus Omnitrophota bacterium]
MKRKTILLILVISLFCVFSFVQAQEPGGLLIDSFEGIIKGGIDGTVDFGAGNGSSVDVSASTDIKYCGEQAIKVAYNAASGGYIWIGRGYGLDAAGAGAWEVLPNDINWPEYSAISFYMYGQNSSRFIAFDIKDAGSEMWRFMVQDNFSGWKQVVCSFPEFYARGDWQPSTADKNANLDFPLKSFQFEPRPEGQGVLYFDCVELIKQ